MPDDSVLQAYLHAILGNAPDPNQQLNQKMMIEALFAQKRPNTGPLSTQVSAPSKPLTVNEKGPAQNQLAPSTFDAVDNAGR